MFQDEGFQIADVMLFNQDVLELYNRWKTPDVIVSDGGYGVSDFKKDAKEPSTLTAWYQPHIQAWSQHSRPGTTLWFWNTEIGWATVHPLLDRSGWDYVCCNIWNKGIQHIAGNCNLPILKGFPIVTEVCVQYVRRPEFQVDDQILTLKRWLRFEWERTQLPLYKTNQACGVANAATRKYFTKDHLWYAPPPELFAKLVSYANQHGVESGKPYFSVDGKKPLTQKTYEHFFAKFKGKYGITNVWEHPPLHNSERVRLPGSSKYAHLNQKPLQLVKMLLEVSSGHSGVIWEPFGGLCTAGLASYLTERHAYCAEIDSEIYRIAVDRIKSHMAKISVKPSRVHRARTQSDRTKISHSKEDAMNNTATIHTRAWAGDEALTLTFPKGWTVETFAPQECPQLTAEQIQTAFDNPIGTPRISALAKGKNSAAIIVDDLSRPTPAADLIPYVLNELAAAGIPKHQIRFVVGGGSHRPIDAGEIDKKVGADIAHAYPVTNHNFMSGDLRALGSLDSGLPIYIDKTVADADFKLCIGGLYPHGNVGFGGGAKLIVPGVSGFATMFYFHTFYANRGHANIERQGDEPDHRDAAEAVAKVLGLDAVVNVTLNRKRQISGVFVGDFVQAQRTGARFARKTYATQAPKTTPDLVIANAYPLDYDPVQTAKALWPLRLFKNAYKVAINPATDGICHHGLYDEIDYARFCKRQSEQPQQELPEPKIEGAHQTLMWSENFPVDEFYKRNPDGVLFRDWDTLLHQLIEKLPHRARVAVFPNAAIQIPAT